MKWIAVPFALELIYAFFAKWYQANPHRFHLITRGVLHALPSPVTRRSQKTFKPEFFDVLKKEKDAMDGVRDVREWLVEKSEGSDMNVGGWNRLDIALEMGGVLKARDRYKSSIQGSFKP